VYTQRPGDSRRTNHTYVPLAALDLADGHAVNTRLLRQLRLGEAHLLA
jgi:hypothetical protein